jgi:hypothetical protein
MKVLSTKVPIAIVALRTDARLARDALASAKGKQKKHEKSP